MLLKVPNPYTLQSFVLPFCIVRRLYQTDFSVGEGPVDAACRTGRCYMCRSAHNWCYWLERHMQPYSNVQAAARSTCLKLKDPWRAAFVSWPSFEGCISEPFTSSNHQQSFTHIPKFMKKKWRDTSRYWDPQIRPTRFSEMKEFMFWETTDSCHIIHIPCIALYEVSYIIIFIFKIFLDFFF